MSPVHDSYRIPEVLRPIEMLDLVEVGGSTLSAAKALDLSQPTVSRHTRRLINDLGLRPTDNREPWSLRHGSNPCLLLMRQAAQLHRLESESWRLGGCPWMEAALQPSRASSAITIRFHHPKAWRNLVAAHTLDVALVSGFDLDLVLPAPLSACGGIRVWEECALLPIGQAPLGLLCPPTQRQLPERWSKVAVPADALAPGLAARVRQAKWRCIYAPRNSQSPDTWADWLSSVNVAVAATPAWARRLKEHLVDWHWQPWPEPAQQTLWILALRTIWHTYPRLRDLELQLKLNLQSFYSESELAP